MKLQLPVVLVIAAALGVAGCGVGYPVAVAHPAEGSVAPAAGTSRPAAPGAASPLSPRTASLAAAAATPPSVVRPHFATPQAAMKYLAAAYNRDDVAALHYVTNQSSFKALIAMRSEAVDLQLRSCAPTGHGDYICGFRHRYPKRLHDSGYGESDFVAAPVISPGWYMYMFGDCG